MSGSVVYFLRVRGGLRIGLARSWDSDMSAMNILALVLYILALGLLPRFSVQAWSALYVWLLCFCLGLLYRRDRLCTFWL